MTVGVVDKMMLCSCDREEQYAAALQYNMHQRCHCRLTKLTCLLLQLP